MRVVILEHENGDEIVHESYLDVAKTVGQCLRKQSRLSREKRQALNIRFETMLRAEFDALPDADKC